ncbi:DUF2218 domain-containing protein [Phenylobacterium sp.]|uniref:DUF2218 domain-containing protein n=1 Tax=Phenylobacterium sp. TaxID=1871053 RepID=UPI00301CF731
MTSTVRVPTASGRRYLQQLCKHWSHKFETRFTPEHGEIALPFGACVLDADDEGLNVRLVPADGADVSRFEQVVADHLARFAFRETLEFPWRREAAD